MAPPTRPVPLAGTTSIDAFDRLAPDDAAELVRRCADVPHWVASVVALRPFGDVERLLDVAGGLARSWSPDDVLGALAHHPRIGERAAATTSASEAAMSRGEQSSVVLDDDVARRLAEGNVAYEERFGRVFLIRAAGRSADEVLAALTARLGNDDATELVVTASELREIALLRLAATVAQHAGEGAAS